MYIAGQVVGVAAVATFVLSYQMKTRKSIIFVNAVSSILYVLQYILLGAFEGATIDVLSTVSTIAAHRKEKLFVKRFAPIILLLINGCIVFSGLILYKNIFSLFPIAGAILQTSAFWITRERTIRLVSFFGAPFWLVYNFTSHAYGATLGSVLCMLSIATAIYRYDIRKQKPHK